MLALDSDERPGASESLKHTFFTRNKFDEQFQKELRMLILKENERKPLNHLHSKSPSESNSTKKKQKKEGSNPKVLQDSLDIQAMLVIGLLMMPPGGNTS